MIQGVIEKEPGNGQAHEALGFIYANAERWPEALASYARAVPLLDNNPSTIGSRNAVAQRLKKELERVYLEEQDLQEVLRQADYVLRWIPGCAWAHEAKGLALADLGREKEAVEELERALVLDRAQTLLGMKKLMEIYQKQGRTQEADVLRMQFNALIRRLPPPESREK
jgi:tetratricopeptide (TPR) repeat protein